MNTYPDYFDAIVSLIGEGKVKICAGKEVDYHDGVTDAPTEAEIDAELIRLRAAYDDLEYARKREVEYPTVAELTIAQYDAADKAALVTKRAAVKTKWPKDNSGPVE